MDHWDPLVTDGLAATREVILFNNAGVSSSGKVPTSVEEMAANAASFIEALGLSKVDVLGFSLGGMVSQALALLKPDLVRRLVLVGTGPRGRRRYGDAYPTGPGCAFGDPVRQSGRRVWVEGLLHA